ncbi:abhydrolase domain-containing protein 11 [Strigomonas culicis]|uniref:Abhydrolase domain-containing protein 11 n=1 Tax=Strigomonas culicis TaxID=28005 RepID=S9VUN8_9TRYP|nr:abhydrolase domain-containing protein 11 [Strigomonas culicis]|eukprot:EPY30886.1 abhydrolase domain-containing protein 11 [Strigomonas culicis]
MSRPVKLHFSQRNGTYASRISRDLRVLVLHGFLAHGIALNTFSNLLLQRLQQRAHHPPPGGQPAAAVKALSVCTVDARNHGLSPHTPTHTIHDLVADLAALLDATQGGASPAVLAVGHSMGAGTWTHLLATQAARRAAVVGLVALDMPPIPASQMSPVLLHSLRHTIDRMDRMRLDALTDMKSVEVECVRCGIFDRRMIGLCTTNIHLPRRGGGGGTPATWKCNLPVLAQSLAGGELFLPESYAAAAPQLEVPVLSVLGGKSPIGGDRRYHNRFPPFVRRPLRVEEVVVPHATHTVYFDKPDATVDAVVHFWKL